MKTMIDLVNLLKDCPLGTKLYCTATGDVSLMEVCDDPDAAWPITVVNKNGISTYLNMYGQLNNLGECMLWPYRGCTNWKKFTPSVVKFNPRDFKPFDKVLVWDACNKQWSADFMSHYDSEMDCYTLITGISLHSNVIPYNEDTEHLVGTSEKCPEYYKWWEK